MYHPNYKNKDFYFRGYEYVKKRIMSTENRSFDMDLLCGLQAQVSRLWELRTAGQSIGSGGEIGHQLYHEFRAGKLDGVNLQGVSADKAQDDG